MFQFLCQIVPDLPEGATFPQWVIYAMLCLVVGGFSAFGTAIVTMWRLFAKQFTAVNESLEECNKDRASLRTTVEHLEKRNEELKQELATLRNDIKALRERS